MSEADITAVLAALRKENGEQYYSVRQVRKELEARGFMVPGYARVHYSLMQLARYKVIEAEPRPVDPLQEWVRRFRAKDTAYK